MLIGARLRVAATVKAVSYVRVDSILQADSDRARTRVRAFNIDSAHIMRFGILF